MIVRATTHQHRCVTVSPDNIHSLVEYVNFLSISQQMHCVWVLSTDVWTNFLTDQMGNFLTNQMRNSYQSGFANVNLKAPWCQMSPEIQPRLPRNALCYGSECIKLCRCVYFMTLYLFFMLKKFVIQCDVYSKWSGSEYWTTSPQIMSHHRIDVCATQGKSIYRHIKCSV